MKKAGVTLHKRRKAPDTTPAEEQRQRTRLRKMSLRSRACSAWIKPSKCPPSSPNWALLALLKAEVYRGGWQAETDDQLKRRVAPCLRDRDWEAVQSRNDRRKTDIRKAADKSPQIFLWLSTKHLDNPLFRKIKKSSHMQKGWKI